VCSTFIHTIIHTVILLYSYIHIPSYPPILLLIPSYPPIDDGSGKLSVWVIKNFKKEEVKVCVYIYIYIQCICI
jgi:hypothetical protein